MIDIISNGSKWYGQAPDSIGKLFTVLKNHPLDRRFDYYSYKLLNGMICFLGNFATVSHVFQIHTDEKWLINKFRRLIGLNKKREDY